MVDKPLGVSRLLSQWTRLDHSLTLTIQLTQNTVTAASRNFTIRTDFLRHGILDYSIEVRATDRKRFPTGTVRVGQVGARARMRLRRGTMAHCAGTADSVSTMRPLRLIVLNASGRGNLVFYTSFCL